MSTCSSNKRQRCQLDDTLTEQDQPLSKKHRPNNQSSTKSSSSSVNDNVWSSPESCLSWLLSKGDDTNSDSSDTLNDFVNNYWSQKPYLLHRNNIDYYKSKGVDIGLDSIHQIIQQHDGEFTFGQNIICKKYDPDTKSEINAMERGETVKLEEIQSLFQDEGATIQFLHSHFYHFEIGNLIFNLESYFGNFVSSNIYITPNQKQGLKAHWDDIEAFILQIRGKKHWTLYALNEEEEQCPIEESHRDLNFDDDSKYSLIMECTLSPGDLLVKFVSLSLGGDMFHVQQSTVHFAQCVDCGDAADGDDYSLHLTISTNQKNHYGHFMKMAVNQCLDHLIQSDIRFRRNVPINIVNAIGDEVNVPKLNPLQSSRKKLFEHTMNGLWDSLKATLFSEDHEVSTSSDGAVSGHGSNQWIRSVMDQMAVHFVSNRYPPTKFLKPEEFAVYGLKENEVQKTEKVEPEMARKDELINKVEDEENRKSIVSAQSEVRLVDPQWIRIVDLKEVDSELEIDKDDTADSGGNGKVLVYSCVRNDHKTHLMAYQEDMASQPLMAFESDKQLFMVLNRSFPDWIKVEELSAQCTNCDMDRIYDLLFALWADGVVETKSKKHS